MQGTCCRLEQALCMLPQSLWVQMSFAHLDLKGFVSWCLFFPLVLIYFLPPLLQSPLIPEGKDWIDTSQLGLRAPRILTLHVCVDLCICSMYCRRSFFGDGQGSCWWKYSRMLIGVILLLLFLKNSSVWSSYLVIWALQSQVFGHSSSVRYGIHPVEWALSQILYCLVAPTNLEPPLP